MKNIHFGKSKAAKVFTGKGFYIALVVSLVAVGCATFFAVNRTYDKLNGGDTLNVDSGNSQNEWAFPDKDANQNQSGVPIGSSSSRGSSQRSSSLSGTSGSQKNTSGSTGSNAVSPNTYAMPLAGDIFNAFSKNELVKSKTMGDWRTHDGIDIKAKIGTPVKSIADGTVAEITEDPMWGVMVVVDHKNGYAGYYCGLGQTVSVKKNQVLTVGDQIGTVGDSAQCELAEEKHLHLGLKKDGKWIDPLSVLNP